MSYQDDRLNQIQAQINHLTNVRRTLREQERSLRGREAYLSQQQTVPNSSVRSLRSHLMGILPNNMVPGNVGGINEVTWPFYFQVNIDFGADPTFADNVFERGFFQVDQEACFLLTSIGRSHSTDENNQSATFLAPLQVDLIDRQSSRRFSNAPIPLQMIGSNSSPSILPVPMYIQPNAFLDVVVSGIPLAASPQDFNGSGAFQLTFFGYRMRIEDAGKVLSNIFSSKAE